MQQYFQIHGASLSYLVFVVIEEIATNDLCMGQNLDVSAHFVLQSLAIALVGEEQAHPVAFVTTGESWVRTWKIIICRVFISNRAKSM